MRRLIKWIGGTAGGIAAYRFVRRHEASLQASPETALGEQDRAEELREKLAESRAGEPVMEEEPAAEPESPEERRARVHEEGRDALGEMRSE
jgi:hypothetical protein